ncbi:MAG: SDR family oxidoreductase [Proteobacteria bacterium]|nr:SDR family oxidoreductase [Pseudomonadota bacterium]
MDLNTQIAVVTGGNRGMGFETCRQLGRKGFRVILTSRDPLKGAAAADKLCEEGLDVLYYQMDVIDETQVQQMVELLKNMDGELAVLINNAGVLQEGKNTSSSVIASSVFHTTLDEVRYCFETNTVGALRVTQKLIPLMQELNYGRVVNVSSGMGALTEMNGGWAGYRMSKAALNAVTRIFSDELKGSNVKINSVCPGFVRTEMSGPSADRSIEEGVETTIWLATLPDNGPTGGFFRDKESIDW